MSDTPREQDLSIGGATVDQGARAAEPPVLDEEDVVELLKRQLAELEESSAEKDKAIEAEKNRAAAEVRARQDAEARARQADMSAQQTRQQSERSTAQAQLDAVSNALESQKGQMGGLKAAWAAAQAEGDFSKAADLQEQMAIVGAKIVQLETGKDALDQRIKNAGTDDGQQQQQQPSERDQRETYIRSMPPRVQDWLRSDKGERYFSDRSFQAKVAAAAQFAQSVKNISPDSAEYIDYIEEQVGLRQPAVTQQVTQQPQGRTPDAAPDGGRRMTAAPAGGSTAGSVRSNADGSTSVYLTADEKDMARRMGVSESDWAREKAAALKANQIGPGARR